MQSEFEFIKMVGTGNDFVMIDNRTDFFPVSNSDFIQNLCDRRSGVGSDGIIIIEESQNCDFKMRIINPDGSEVDMCGNGARCAVKFAKSLGLFSESGTIETRAGILKAESINQQIKLNMGYPKDIRNSFLLKENSIDHEVFFVNTGVPHVVVFTKDVSSADVVRIGRWIRYHHNFQPDGTNCNFVEITGKNSIKVRTYERGVENETFSCGTGTCASAIISVLYKNLSWPVTSTTLMKEQLIVDSQMTKENSHHDFFLIGPVLETFRGIKSLSEKVTT